MPLYSMETGNKHQSGGPLSPKEWLYLLPSVWIVLWYGVLFAVLDAFVPVSADRVPVNQASALLKSCIVVYLSDLV